MATFQDRITSAYNAENARRAAEGLPRLKKLIFGKQQSGHLVPALIGLTQEAALILTPP